MSLAMFTPGPCEHLPEVRAVPDDPGAIWPLEVCAKCEASRLDGGDWTNPAQPGTETE